MNRFLFFVTIASVLTFNYLCASAVECPEMPKQIKKDWAVEVDTEVAKIGFVRGIDLKIKTNNATKDLLGKLPNADKTYLETMMYSSFCSALRDDKNITESERRKIIQEYNRELRKAFETYTPREPKDMHNAKQKKNRKHTSKKTTTNPPPEPLPRTADLRLQFFGKDNLALNFINTGNETAQQPKYWAAIADLSNQYSFPNAPNDVQPLPIRCKVLNDFIKSKQGMGNIGFIYINDGARSHVKPNDKLFGLVWGTCANCTGNRSYWLYYEVGIGGWYAYNSPERPMPNFIFKRGLSNEEINNHLNKFIPQHERINMPEKDPLTIYPTNNR